MQLTIPSSSKMKSTLNLLIGISVLRILMDWIYIAYLNDIYDYMGFELYFDHNKYTISWALLITFSLLFSKLYNNKNLSSAILVFLFYIAFVPFTTMVALNGVSYQFILYSSIYWFSLIVWYHVLPIIRLRKRDSTASSNVILFYLLGFSAFVVLLVSYLITGFRFSLNLSKVYEFRSEAAQFNLPIILSYSYAATKLINPIFLVHFLAKKKLWLALIVVAIQLFSFSINGSKTVLFSTVLSVLVFYAYRSRFLYRLHIFMIGFCVFSIIEATTIKTHFIINYLIRRALFIPNLLNTYYFDFFANHEPDLFRQSFLRHFGLKSPYSNPIDNMIGAVYFNKPDLGANNGLFSDAMSNLGYLGIIVMPLLLVVFLRFMDACARGLSMRMLIVFALTASFVLNGSYLFTSLLTHGLLLSCFTLLILPREIGVPGERCQ